MTNGAEGRRKEKYWDYFILVARFLLGWTFLRYGYSKLVDSQFGISEAELAIPVQEVSLFRLSWYLFDHQPFKAFIGVSQLLCGSLLIINRTALLGAFLFLPLITTILVIDLTFMPENLAVAFAFRLGFYLVLDGLILWHYKDRMITIWQAIWNSINTKFKFPIRAYLILPLMAMVLEVIGIVPKLITMMIVRPAGIVETLGKIPEFLTDIIKKIGS